MDDAAAGPRASQADPPARAHALEVDIRKRLGAFQLEARFAVGQELIVLFGHSGSGKSLTLQAIAGLLRPDAGRIAINGAAVLDTARGVDLPPQRRGVGMVVQQYALFPHLSVRDNITFGLHGLPKGAARARADALLHLLEIDGLADRRPGTISGGQAQRVALARALAPRPRLLLLDEPFSALDSAIRTGLRRELGRLKRDLELTIVFVTHDLGEAYNLADKIAVFDGGRVLQVGARNEVFNRPASPRVARLTEVRNIWEGRVMEAGGESVTVTTERLRVRATGAGWAVGDAVSICIRPERVIVLRPERVPADTPRDTVVTAELVDQIAHGASYTLFFRLPNGAPEREFDIEVDLAVHPYEVLGMGERRTWALALPREAVHVMPIA